MNIPSSTQGMPINCLVPTCQSRLSAYLEYCEIVKGPQISFDMWDQHLKTAPQFKFCTTVMDNYWWHVLSIPWGIGNFKLYVRACDELFSCFHALDHIKLCTKHPNFHDKFMKGFSLQKSTKILVTWLKIKPMNSATKASKWKAEQSDSTKTPRPFLCSC